jgi:uncharacterized damage-inducible protein DinB
VVEQISKDHFFQAFMSVLVETFESGRAGYLDQGTSILETLATITAEEASRPVSPNCATIAAHVAHITVAMDFSVHLFRGETLQVDWGEVWQTVREVNDEEWKASQQHLRESYVAFRELSQSTPWQNVNEIMAAMEVLAHSAYHLGEIRHALCTVKPGH